MLSFPISGNAVEERLSKCEIGKIVNAFYLLAVDGLGRITEFLLAKAISAAAFQ